MIFPRRTLLLALSAVSLLPAAAQVRLPHVFTDGAVLQRDRAVPVWGSAAAGKKVIVKFGGQEKSVQAAADGKWRVDLDAMPASAEARVLEVSEEGGQKVEVKDLLVGEVWLASGQSNMEWTIANTRPEDQQIAKAGPVPLLRILTVAKKLSPYRLEDFEGRWQPATPDTVPGFSAVAYFFGRRLTEELGVPVGLISSSWGGSRIEPWLADEGFADVPDLRESPSLRLIELLDERGAQTAYHDPFVAEIPRTRAYGALMGRRSVALDAETLAGFDAVLIATDHDAVDYAAIAAHAPLIIDTRNVMARLGLPAASVVKA
jgi:hypothetical protein